MKSNGSPTAGTVDRKKILNGQNQKMKRKVQNSMYLLIFSVILALVGCSHSGSQATLSTKEAGSPVYEETSNLEESIVFLPVDPNIHAPVIAEPPPLGLASNLNEAKENTSSNLKTTIYIPSEDMSGNQESGVNDLRSKIYVPSEQATIAEPGDLRSKIFVPSEQPENTNDLRSKIYVPSEAP